MKKNSKMLNLGLLLVFQTGQANEKIVFCVKKKQQKNYWFWGWNTKSLSFLFPICNS